MDIKEIEQIVSKEKIYMNEPMCKHTSFKIGGPAECLIKINTIEELRAILKFAKERDIELTIIGNGSNLLVSDDGIKGIVLKIEFDEIDVEMLEVEENNLIKENNEVEESNVTKENNLEKENNQVELQKNVKITVGSGVKLGLLAQKCLKQEITGFEFASGIPGTIGGAIRMNAGAHGSEMKDVVKTITYMERNGEIHTISNEQAEFEYRNSLFARKNYIILEVQIQLAKGNKEEIQSKMQEYANYRKEKQPIEFPSAGSTFKRGTDFITAKLIDECGLKGYQIGGAQISEKHAGFIINKGNATAKDVKDLMEYTREQVYNRFGKIIESEIEII